MVSTEHRSTIKWLAGLGFLLVVVGVPAGWWILTSESSSGSSLQYQGQSIDDWFSKARARPFDPRVIAGQRGLIDPIHAEAFRAMGPAAAEWLAIKLMEAPTWKEELCERLKPPKQAS